MASFCGNCGAPLGQSTFCAQCSARAVLQPAASSPSSYSVPVSAAKSGTSFLNIAVIAGGLLFLFGAFAIGGIYYAGHKLIGGVDRATGQAPGTLANSMRAAAASAADAERGRDPKRDGCLLLPKEQAAAILGVPIERIDGKPNEREGGEHCEYFIQRETAEESAEMVSKKLTALKPGSTAKNGPEDLIKTLGRAAAATSPDGPFFSFTVEREDGQVQFVAFKAANVLGGADPLKSSEPLSGLGDRAAMGPMNSMLCVVTGNTSIMLDLTQVPQARGKGIALAKAILSGLRI